MLMYAPPPQEDVQPFLAVSKYLSQHGLRAPETLHEQVQDGMVLLEDFGDERLADRMVQNADQEEEQYAKAVDTLVALHQAEPGNFAAYDLMTYLREADLFTEWYCRAANHEVDADAYRTAWSDVLTDLLARQDREVTVLRDYHAENVMLTPTGDQGLIDFQDALVGHRAYDLVSLLQDARRDVSVDLERRMIERYTDAVPSNSHFLSDYAVLGAQRNAKIVGIFSRLAARDGKPRYLALIPRVWAMLERDLKHPALAPVADWFAQNLPADVREAGGGLPE